MSDVEEFDPKGLVKQNDGQPIGHGSEGLIYKVNHSLHGLMAAKYFKLKPNDRRLPQEVRREVEQIKCTQHQNIVRFLGLIVETSAATKIVIGYAMEYMADGSLSAVIYNSGIPYGTSEVVEWARQAALALAWLHSKNVIHRDVKPENMLMSDGRKSLKLCDFGTSRRRHENISMTLGVGTIVYMAPELLIPEDHAVYCNKCDVYSMGITLWEMETRKFPYRDDAIQTDLSKYITEGNRPPIDLITSDVLSDIIERCFSTNPQNRPTMVELENELKELRHVLNPFGAREDREPTAVSNVGMIIRIRKATNRRTTPYFDNPFFPEKQVRLLKLKNSLHNFDWSPIDDTCFAQFYGEYILLNFTKSEDHKHSNELLVMPRGSLKELYNKWYQILTMPLTVFTREWSSDGRRFATGCGDGTIFIWDSEGDLRHTLKAQSSVDHLKWNRSGSCIICAGYKKADFGKVQLIDINNGAFIRKWACHNEYVVSLEWISNDTFVSCGRGGTIQIYHAEQRIPIKTLHAHEKNIGLWVHPSTTTLTSISTDTYTIQRWSLADDNKKPLQEWHSPYITKQGGFDIYFVEMSSNGNLLASVTETTVHLMDLQSEQLVHTLVAETEVRTMAFSPDDRFLAVLASPGSIYFWELTHGSLLQRYSSNIPSRSIKWNCRGDKMAVHCSDSIILLDVRHIRDLVLD